MKQIKNTITNILGPFIKNEAIMWKKKNETLLGQVTNVLELDCHKSNKYKLQVIVTVWLKYFQWPP